MGILLAGAKGQVGWELTRQARHAGLPLLPLDRHQLDITDRANVEALLEAESPRLLINAAAYTQVDRAEKEEAQAFQVNCHGPGHLAECCRKAQIPLIHLSTDYVFDGTKGQPYTETDPVSPTGAYGRSKAAGEERVRQALASHLIVRTSWVYGVHGRNFVKTMLALGRTKEKIAVIADQQGCPTAASDIAGVLLTLARSFLEKGSLRWGTYHYCGHGITSWHGFAETIFDTARRFGYPHRPVISAISTAQYPTLARRPPYSALDCSKISRHLGIQPVLWQDSLEAVVEELLRRP
jgi:dTDP-4-dehydrorhamnose reductase